MSTNRPPIYSKLHPAIIDRHRERICRTIYNNPGITLTDLGRKITYLNATDRRGFLKELIAAGRVEERKVLSFNGRMKPTYWPCVAA